MSATIPGKHFAEPGRQGPLWSFEKEIGPGVFLRVELVPTWAFPNCQHTNLRLEQTISYGGATYALQQKELP